MNDVTDRVLQIIYKVYDSLEHNNLAASGKPEAAVWERPLIGVAAGNDNYFEFLKEHIGSFCWSPAEAFGLKYGEVPESSRLRVLSVIFPHTKETRMLQSNEMNFPCNNWAVSRGEWGIFAKEFAEKTEEAFEREGIRAVAIDLRPEFSLAGSEKYGRASVWSHRHAAFAAGMGTFGLSDGFITEKGKAVRITSIIIESDIAVTPRDNRGHYDWCLFYRNGTCGACVQRCPKHAISEQGHDKEKCAAYLAVCYKELSGKMDVSNYPEVGCGLCQSKVPCMDKRP